MKKTDFLFLPDNSEIGRLLAAKHPAAVALGKLGGSVTSPAKAAASRANGKKGGRPKMDEFATAAGVFGMIVPEALPVLSVPAVPAARGRKKGRNVEKSGKPAGTSRTGKIHENAEKTGIRARSSVG